MSSWLRIVFWPLRFIAIYFAFFLLAFGAAILGFVLMPIWQLLSRQYFNAEQHRLIISKGARLYLWLLKSCGLLDVRYENFTNLSENEAVVFVANHPSLLDILFFFAHFPRCCCLVKDDLARFSPYAPLIRGAAYLKNSSLEILEEAKSELTRGNPIVIFPEGSRTDFNKKDRASITKLQRGAANIALRCDSKIAPVAIELRPRVLGKYQAWYQLPSEKCYARLTLLPVLDVGIDQEESAQTAARRITSKLEELFASIDCS